MSYYVETSEVDCRECGLPVRVPLHMWNRLAASGGTFLCPNGHTIRPKAPTDIAQLKERIAKLTADLEESQRVLASVCVLRDGAWTTINHLRRSNNALRGHIKRIRRGAR